ncbi:MAG: nucleotidyltransferase domain-containing protein [Chthoniobacterales bacterium]|nr:nucleotidyltransferase domain-containing protein [Chthoniobacterales bacterium]
MSVVLNYLSVQAGVRRIWLFGSLAKGRPSDWRSDLDIAVEGLDGALLGRTWSELDSLLQLPLDLVRWEDASELLRNESRSGENFFMPLNEGAAASLRAIIAHDCEALDRLDERLHGLMGEFAATWRQLLIACTTSTTRSKIRANRSRARSRNTSSIRLSGTRNCSRRCFWIYRVATAGVS